MVSLTSVQGRFDIPFQLVEGGTGVIRGVVSEAEQNSQPSYVFVAPRRVLRVQAKGLLKTGVVIQSPEGAYYIVGDNGPSETSRGLLWESFRLFEATSRSRWQRRLKTVDPVTTLERDSGLQDLGNIWVAIEPIDRETLDRKVHASFEISRYIAASNVQENDILDGKPVMRADTQLGLRIGTLG